MKQIQLTKGYVALVDDEDFEALNAYQWCVFRTGRGRTAVRMIPDPTKKSRQRTIQMHRVITGAKEGQCAVALDGNKLNCQKSNLLVVKQGVAQVISRHIDYTEPQQVDADLPRADRATYTRTRKPYHRKNRNATSAYRGVSLHRRSAKWQATCQREGKLHWAGFHDTEELAALAYDKKATELYGSDALLNFPVVIDQQPLEETAPGFHNPLHTKKESPTATHKKTKRTNSLVCFFRSLFGQNQQ